MNNIILYELYNVNNKKKIYNLKLIFNTFTNNGTHKLFNNTSNT